MPDEIRAEQAAWSGRGIARPMCISAPLVPRHSGRAFGKMNPFRCVFALLAIVLIIAGCNRQDPMGRPTTDAAIQERIIGTWGMEISNVEGRITLRPDRSYSGYWSNTVRPKGWRAEGEWRVADGALVTQITNKTAWNFTLSGPTGTVAVVRILRLTDHELVTQWTNKQTNGPASNEAEPIVSGDAGERPCSIPDFWFRRA